MKPFLRPDFGTNSFPLYHDTSVRISAIIENLNKHIFEELGKNNNEHVRDMLLDFTAGSLTGLIGSLLVFNNPAAGPAFVVSADQFRKSIFAGLGVTWEELNKYYLDWKAKNEERHNDLRKYFENMRDNFYQDIRKLSDQEDKRIAVLFDDADMASDYIEELGNLLVNTRGKILWVLVIGSKEKLKAFHDEYSGVAKSITIEANDLTLADVKMDMAKAPNLSERSKDAIYDNAIIIHDYTHGNPELSSIYLQLWSECDDKKRWSFKGDYFGGGKQKSVDKAIGVILGRLATRHDREFGYLSMLFYLSIVSGNIGALLYKEYTDIKYEILARIDRRTFMLVQENGSHI